MKKKFRALTALAAGVLLASFPLTASAETFYGEDGWGVVFNGSEMTSTFTNAAIDDVIYQMQPGDTASIRLELENDYDGNTDWYMTNQVLQSLEDSQSVAEGGAYGYVLTYTGPDGTEDVLYSSENVGGETVNESGEGLHQATDSLEDYFYLDTLSGGEAGAVTLEVHLEGETQGNAYQDTLAQLQMNFAVEQVSDGTGSGPGGGRVPGTGIVKTGDTSRVMLFSVIALMAGIFFLIFVAYRIRKSRKEARAEVPDGAAQYGNVSGRREKGGRE